MKSHFLNNTTVRPLKPVYSNDKHLTTSSNTINTKSGLSIVTNNMFDDAMDLKINDGDLLLMTDKKFSKTELTLDVPGADDIFPYTFITYFAFTDVRDQLYTLNTGVASYPTNTSGRFIPQFLQIHEDTDNTATTRNYTVSAAGVYTPILNYTSIPNNHLFQVELLDNFHCRITHDDGYVKTALTYADTTQPDTVCTFELDEPSTDPKHKQVFVYQMQDSIGYMGLIKVLSDGTRTNIIHTGDGEGQDYITNGVLKGYNESIAANGMDVKSLAKTRPNSRVNTVTQIRNKSMDTMWYKYNTWHTDTKQRYNHATQNTVEVDESVANVFGNGAYFYTNSYINLTNNFMIDCQYTNITGDQMHINITPLKNQLTPHGAQGENNPHATGDGGEFCIDMGTRRAVDYRTYQKIFNGSNQNRTNGQMCLAYTSYTDMIKLKSDQLTYFHMPNIMKPYVWMNVNYRRVPDEYPENYEKAMSFPVARPGAKGFDFEDFVGLIRAGAVPGSAPINADKIFKKRADYRYFSHWGDSGLAGNRGDEGDAMFGTWLCAWLREGSNDQVDKKFGPMWMDRYYDDSRFSEHQVIDKPPNCISTGPFDGGIVQRAMSTYGYFDIPSELRLERGVQYAYHHIGKKHTKLMIDAFSDFMFHEDVDNFTAVISGEETPGTVRLEDESKTYIFDGTTRGQGVAPDPSHGDFRMSFWMHSEDWSSSFGHQIMGNYVNDGVAVTNNNVITPVLVFDNKQDGVVFTNTDGETITTISPSRYTDDTTGDIGSQNNPTILHTRDETLGDVSIITSVPGHSLINRFDLNGTLTNTYTIQGGLYESKTKIIAMDSMFEYVFTLFEGQSGIGRFDLRSGEFLDLDKSDFETVIVSGANETTIGVNRDFPYVLDDSLIYNNKPVYVSVGSSIPYYIVYDNSRERWLITPDGAEYTPDDYALYTTSSEVGDDGLFTFVSDNEKYQDVEIQGQPFYADWKPPATYISPVADSTDHANIIIQDSQTMFVIDGDCVCDSPPSWRGGNNLIHFSKNGNIYSHNKAFSRRLRYTTEVPVIESTDQVSAIHNIKVDSENNLWVLYTGLVNDVSTYHIAKYDPMYNLIFNKSLSSSDTMSFDLVSEYSIGGVHEHHGVVFSRTSEAGDDSPGSTDVIHVLSDGTIRTKTTISRDIIGGGSHGTSTYFNHKNMSNFNNINKMYKDNTNNLTFKFRAKNKYNQTDYVNIIESFDVSKLHSGWHHFSFGFDANLKGIGYFYIDGMLVEERPLLGVDQLGKYGWTDVLSKKITIGATQGYNNNLLSTMLNQPGYYYAKNFKIKSFRMYNFNLYRGYIKALAREHVPDQDMYWVIPSGRKAHLDHVEKIHMHRLPGYKSNDFDINMINTGVSGGAQQELTSKLKQVITNYSPANTNNTGIDWIEQPHSIGHIEYIPPPYDGDAPI